MTREAAVELLTRVLSALSVAFAMLLLLVSNGQIVSQDLPAQVVPLAVVLRPELFPDLVANLPSSQLVFNGLVLALGGLVPLRWAVVVVLLLGLIGWVAAWAALARRFGGHPWASAAVGAASWLGWLHVMGFHNYLFGNLFCAGAAAVWLHRPTRSGAAWAAALLAIAALSHPFAALHGIALLALGAVSVMGLRGALGRAPWVAPALALSLWALGRSYLGQNSVAGLEVLATGWQWGDAAGRLTDLVGTTFVAYHGSGWVLGVAVAALTLASPWLAGPTWRRPVAVVALGGLALALVAPSSGLGWAWVGQRLSALPLLVAVAAMAQSARPAPGRWIALALVVLTAGRGAFDLATHQPIARQLGASVADFGDAPVGRAYAVWVQEPVPVAAPHALVDVGTAGWSALNGGMLPGMFATTPSIHWALFRQPVGALLPDAHRMFAVFPPCASLETCGSQWSAAAQQVALDARAFDTVVIVHPDPRLVAGLVGLGFEPIAPAVLRVQTATLAVELPEGFTAPDPIAQVALADGTPVAQSTFSVGPSGRLTATLPGLLAGGAVLRVGSRDSLLMEQTIAVLPGSTRTLRLGAGAGP